jgi:tRNA (guanine37-N1)-methyltransferase
MRFDVITLFPAMFAAVTEHGITRRAHELGLWSLVSWNPRDFTRDAHRTVDDRPYGGGPGMVMMAEPLAQAVAAAEADGGAARVIAFAPGGTPLTDARVRRLAGEGGSLALVCGRYEAIDERFLEECVDEVVSVGDFVMSGGEVPAMALIDAIVRQLPGALKQASADE